MGFFEWISRPFRKVRNQPLELSYSMDMDDSGQHVVQVYRQVRDQRQPVPDVWSLLRYDYHELGDNGRVLYSVSPEDRQVLLSMRSLNPTMANDGALRFEVTPPILQYLRKKPSVAETASAKEVTIASSPLKPTLKVAFDPKTGLTVEAGYPVDDAGTLVAADKLPTVGNGQYVRIGKTLEPLPQKLSDAAETLLGKTILQLAPHQIPEFFTRDLVLLKHDFNAVLTDAANQIRVIDETSAPIVKVDKTASGWLEFQVEYQIGDRAWAQSVLMKNGAAQYQQLDETTWVKTNRKVLADVQKHLNELGAVTSGAGYRLPVSQFASLDEFIQAIGGIRQLGAAYQEFVDQLTGFQADRNFTLVQPIEQQLQEHHITLRPYQREGIHWLHWLNNHRLHGLLADDMGLGKTMQVICAMGQAYHQLGSTEPSLIVAPKSVLIHWQRELQRCLPQALTYIYHGSQRQQMRHLFSAAKPIIFISTYATVTNDIDELSKVPFFYLVLDEATSIKNPSARRTQGIKALNAGHRIALSGTPIENRPAELWSLFDFLLRGHLGRYGTFQRLFETPITNGNQTAADALGRRVRPFMLRRMKEEVATDLPEKIEMTEWCELTEEQKQLYGSLQDAAKGVRAALSRGERIDYTTNILPIITKLKQICDHPALVIDRKEPLAGRSEKFDLIVEKVANILAQGEQVVIFSHFLGMLNLIEAAITKSHVAHIRIDGSTGNRQALVDHFNQGAARVALCSLQAAGTGITLTGGNHVIHADRWWNPAVEDQATDRVHRIGQNKTVYVYRILTEGTLEERIDQLLAQKRDMADQVIGAAGKVRLQWTREELLEILKPLK